LFLVPVHSGAGDGGDVEVETHKFCLGVGSEMCQKLMVLSCAFVLKLVIARETEHDTWGIQYRNH